MKMINKSMSCSPMLENRSYRTYLNKLILWDYFRMCGFPDQEIKNRYMSMKQMNQSTDTNQLEMGPAPEERQLPDRPGDEVTEISEEQYRELIMAYSDYMRMLEIIQKSGKEYSRYLKLLEFEKFLKANYQFEFTTYYGEWLREIRQK